MKIKYITLCGLLLACSLDASMYSQSVPEVPQIAAPEITTPEQIHDLSTHLSMNQLAVAKRAIATAQSNCDQRLKQAHDKGYDVLQYDASSGVSRWTGASVRWPLNDPTPHSEMLRDPGADPTASLGPIAVTAHTQDLVMVQVCHLRFDSTVNVSATTVSTGDRVIDIRGTTPTTAVATAATTNDALQTALSGATNSALAATLPSATAPPGFGANTVVTLGSTKAGSYTPASIAAAPQDFSRGIQAYRAESSAALREINQLCSDPLRGCNRNGVTTNYASATTAGSVLDVYSRALSFRKEIETLYQQDNTLSNTGLFDKAKADAQQFAVVLAALDSKITAANLGAQLPVLATSYRAMAGDLFTIREIELADRQLVGGGPAACPYSPADTTTKQSQTSVKGTKTPEQDTQETVSSSAVQSKENLLDGEYCYIQQYQRELVRLGLQLNGDEIQGAITPNELFGALSGLRDDLEAINQEVNAALAEINLWYSSSQAFFADVLTPMSSNTALRVGISAVETYVPFTLSFSSSSTSSSSASSGAVSGHFPSSTLIEVERRVHFNVVGGVLAIHVPTSTFSLLESTTAGTVGTPIAPCGGNSTVTDMAMTNYYCPVTTSSSNWQIAGITALNWIPWGRNYYPRVLSREEEHVKYTNPHTYRDMFGFMLGTSVTSLGTVFGGVDVEPWNGLDFYVGGASAHGQVLQSGAGAASNIYTTSTPPIDSTLHWGFAYGVGFDVSVLAQIFKGGSPSAPTTP